MAYIYVKGDFLFCLVFPNFNLFQQVYNNISFQLSDTFKIRMFPLEMDKEIYTYWEQIIMKYNN